MVLLAALAGAAVALLGAGRTSAWVRPSRAARARSWKGSSASSSTRWCCARSWRATRRFRAAAGAGAGDDAGRVRAPGRAVREAGGGAAAGAQPEPHAALPGDVRARRTCRRGDLRLPGAGAASRWRSEATHVEVRPDLYLTETPQRAGRRRWSTAPTCSTRRRCARMVEHLRVLLEAWSAKPDAQCRELPLLRTAERAAGAGGRGTRRRRSTARDARSTRSSRRRRRGRRMRVARGAATGSALTYARAGRAGEPAGAPPARAGRGPGGAGGPVRGALARMVVGAARHPEGRRRVRAAGSGYPAERLGWHAGGRAGRRCW